MPNDTDYMEDSPGQDAPPDKAGGDDKEKGDSPTFLVNKEAYPDAKPGDMFKMRVAAVHDKEMECTVEKGDEQEEGEEAPPEEASMPGASGPPDSMMD
jgi:hypothetical protein